MKSKKLIIRVVCIVLAVLILAAGTVLVILNLNKKPAKKKKVIKKVVVVQEDPTETPTLPEDFGVIDDPNSNFDDTYERVRRKLTFKQVYQAPKYVPEYAKTEADWAGPEGYVIVASKDIRACRDAAKRLQEYFKKTTGITVPCVTDETPVAAKEILVGDTNRRTSKLKSTEFAVKLEGQTLVFEGGHFAMAENAVDWFMSFDYKAGKVNLLTGEIKDFLPSVTVDGKTYDYAWGDEHGGNSLNTLKWCFVPRMTCCSLNAYYVDQDQYPYVYVDEGQLKLVAGRYYDMFNTNMPYVTNTSITSKMQMSFIMGYYEIRARIPLKSGAWPSYWFASDDGLQNRYKGAPANGQPKYSLFLEIDFIEAHDRITYPNLHKWYSSASNRYAETGVKHTSWGSFAFNPKIVGAPLDNPEKASYEYHTHAMYWTADKMSFYLDNKEYFTFDLTYNFDGPDYDNDAAKHFTDMPVYPIICNTLHTPLCSYAHSTKKTDESQYPMEYFIDYTRLYQEQGQGEINFAVEE
ncbi:MAG: hypothetical protein IKK77_04830 [Clostridia bacterium]|nr:hypothetical protein [Clostridia bacterium]